VRKQTKLWTQKNGDKIRICDMSDSHIVNTVRMIKRKAEFKKMQVDVGFLSCGRPQGDMAQDAFDRECCEAWNKSWEDYAPKIFPNLLQDIVRRAILRPGILTQLIGIPNWMTGR